jgi:Protein of unknown function (DUF3102)
MTATNQPTLADRAAEINRLYEGVDRADGAAKRKRIEVGNALIEARKHVPDGEWNAWCKANIQRSRQDIARVMKMAGAEDPEAAHAAENAARRAAAGRNTVLHVETPAPAVLAEGGFFGPLPAPAIDVEASEPAPVVEVVDPVEPAPVEVEASEYTIERQRLMNECKTTIAKLDNEGLLAVSAIAKSRVGFRINTIMAMMEGATDNRIEQVNAQFSVVEPFVYDIGPRFIAFVKANPDLEADAIRSLHSAIDAFESICRDMREPLIEIGEARYAAKHKAAKLAIVEPVTEIESVEVGAAVEPSPAPVAKCTVTGCEGGNRFETVDGVRHDMGLCGACHPEAYEAEAVETPPKLNQLGLALNAALAEPPPKSNKLDFVVAKPAPKNRRSKIGEVRQATPEAIAAYAASHGLGVAA